MSKRGGKRKNTRVKGQKDSGPVIFRNCSFDLVKAITVYVAKKTGAKTITPEIMLLTVQTLNNMCDSPH